MLGSKKQKIEDIIIETLAKNPYITGPTLLKLIKQKRLKTTKQAMYAALSPLQENEIIHKRKQEYFLTNTWLNFIYNLVNKELVPDDEIFTLKEGQSISYRFPSLLSCDKYWAHIFSRLIKKQYKPKGVMLWYPHYIFLIGRNKVEEEIIEDHTKYKNTGYYSFRGNTPLDREIKKNYTSNYLRINTGEYVGFKSNYFLNIFGDIIIEVFIPIALSKKIENWYEKINKPTVADISEFKGFFNESYKIRMKISRNVKKSTKLRNKLSKNFYIPGGIKI